MVAEAPLHDQKEPGDLVRRSEWLVSASVAKNIEAIKNYNLALLSADEPSRTEALEKVRTDFRIAVDLATRALEIVKESRELTNSEEANLLNSARLLALAARAQSVGLLVRKVDRANRNAARSAFSEYITAEPNLAKKLRAKQLLAQTLLDAGAIGEALAEYERLAAEDPNDLNARGNLGLISFELGTASEKAGKKAEAAVYFDRAVNYLQGFVDQAGDTNDLKGEAMTILTNLKSLKTIEPPTAAPSKRP